MPPERATLTPGLLERDAELAALDDLVAGAAGGRGRLTLIEGPAGIGKSGLLAGLRERAGGGPPRPAVRDDGAAPRGGPLRVLAARASELEREFAFGVVRQLFEADVAVRRDAALAGAAAPAAAVFEAEPAADGGLGASFAALHGLYWLTLNLAAERPLLLAVDDLHWCDRPSLRFLAYLARRLDGAPVLVATTLRSNEPPTDPALLGEIVNDPATLPLRPGPLSATAVDELVRERLGAGADVAFCTACHEATGGNPLLLRQLLRALEAEGVRPEADQAAVVRAIGPRAVSGTVLLRLARQSSDARAVARAAAVLGESAALPAVAVLAGTDERAAAAATGELIRAEILRPDPPLGFVHPLVRDAVYHEIPPAERELEHERAALVLRDTGAGIEQTAAQLLVAPRRGEPWVAELLQRAGAAAMRKGAADSAVAYLRRALDEPPPADRRTAVLLALGTAEALTIGPAASAHLQDAYDALEDPHERGEIASLLAHTLLFTGFPSEARVVAGRAISELGPEDGELARALETLELSTYFFGGGGTELLARLEEYRRPPSVPGPGAKALAGVASYDWANRGGTADECAALALAALEGGELLSLERGLIVIIAAATLVLADRREALDWLAALEADAHRRGSLLDIASVHLWVGHTQWRHGQLDEAAELLRTAIGEFEIYGLGAGPAAYAEAFLCQVLVEQGDLAGARRAVERGLDTGDASDGPRHLRYAELALLVAEGRWEEALAASGAYAARFAAYADSPGGAWRVRRAEALDRLGRADEAAAVAREDLARARRFGAPWDVGRALRVLGRIEREAGLEHVEEAVAVLAGSTARLEHAKALVALGTALRHARRAADAREPLRAALELASACGAPPLADAARSELYASGARPRTDALSGVAALTASERRVADLAASGDTNRDIAQALYVTPKTVEVHLSNAYRKLGVRSRRELPEVLAT
ncbi:MAG TPA: AAA family ATPase [Solirubrobacteraceae bacterium]|nr:AAA family ATPase [Solirubrobacteraceae bacterium]